MSAGARKPHRDVGVGDLPSDRDAAVSALYARRYSGLVGLASLLVDNTEDAHDVVQDAFVRLYDRWDRLRDAERAEGYLRVSVVNGCWSTLRRRMLIRRHRVDRSEVSEDVSEEVANRLRGDVLAVALRRLPRRERECVVLRYYADLSEAQTAATLKVSIGAVKGYASRGLVKLAALLQEVQP